jgi:chemotaxis protein methyltransferase CheR
VLPSGGDDEVVALVCERTGLVFPPGRRAELTQRITEAMGRAGIRELPRYLAALAEDEGVFNDLAESLTVGETYFFREPEQFEFLRTTAIPSLLRRTGGRSEIRAWSAGCATGEEAYSLAILLREAGVPHSRLLGTDLSAGRVERAREGRYTGWSLRGVPEEVVQRYFRARGKHYHLDREILGSVTFRPLNLLADGYPSLASDIWKMDLVLCRNVLIYLSPEAVAAVGRRLIDSLSDDGWLLLSASDPPLGGVTECETVVTPAGVAYRRRRARSRPPPAARRAPAAPVAPPRDAARRAPRAEPPRAEPATPPAAPPPAPPAAVSDDGADAWVARVRALADRGKREEAEQACIAALESHPMHAELTYLQAVLLLASDRCDEAAAAARRALYLDRSLVVAHLVLAQSSARRHDRKGTLRALRNAARLLTSVPTEAGVAGAPGETAGRMLSGVQLQLQLLEAAA